MTLSVTSYLALYGLSALIWSPLSDHVGRRPMLLLGLLGFMASSIPLIIWPNFPVLVSIRGVQAASIASFIPIGGAIIRDISKNSTRDTFINFYQYAQSITFVLAPVLGGTLSNFLNFRSLFFDILNLRPKYSSN